jgi:hypothetical protein
MHLVAISVLIQIGCAVHCVRNRGNRMWLMVIIFLSIPGCAAYAIFEVLPQYAGNRKVRRVTKAAVKALDPEREIRAAREAIETADTAANRLALADALADNGRWSEAIAHYDAAQEKGPAPERSTGFKLARACFEAGRFERARELLDAVPPSGSQAENDRTTLLRARLLEHDGDAVEALAVYADVGKRLPGAEAQCRQAALLLALGRRNEAMSALIEAERRAKRVDTFERADHADMYDWAARTLSDLRANQLGA